MKILWQAVLLILITASAYAGNKAIEIEIFDNISSEFAECSSYFSIVSQAMKSAGHKTVADKYGQASDTAIKYALMTAEKIRNREMAQKVTLSRFEAGMKGMLKDMDNNIGNISILSNKYALRCKRALEEPEVMMKEWGKKILSKKQR